jgi:hypothetical protein
MSELEVSRPVLPPEVDAVAKRALPMRQWSSSISANPAKWKSMQVDTAASLLHQLELLRRELQTLLEQDAHFAMRCFERLDRSSTNRLSRADFCSALEQLGIGEQLANTDWLRTPLVRELRFALASACVDVNMRAVAYREPHLRAAL